MNAIDASQVPPHEGNINVKMGHVCFIPDTKDFFIAYGDHPEWGTAHTVRRCCGRARERAAAPSARRRRRLRLRQALHNPAVCSGWRGGS